MSGGYPWAIEDKINAAIRDLAKSHEVSAVRSDVDRLEHSLRETRALVDGLRDELAASQERWMNLVDVVAGLAALVERFQSSQSGCRE